MRNFYQDFEMGVTAKLRCHFRVWHSKFPQSVMAGAPPDVDIS